MSTSDEDFPHPFSKSDWEACLRVLEQLKKDPYNNPDNEHFKSLVGKIRKNAQKSVKQEVRQEKKQADLILQKETLIVQRALAGNSVYHQNEDPSAPKEQFTKLQQPKNCYCCTKQFVQLHFFYNRLCPACAVANYAERFAELNFEGQTAIVTGCRVKVGYATALRLLRAGASVLGTTRFPALAEATYSKEPDYAEWSERLFIYGLDLRDLKQTLSFTQFASTHFSGLNMLINNAAQTIRYTEEFYQPLIAAEQKLLQLNNGGRRMPNATPVVSDQKALAPEVLQEISAKLTRFGQPVDARDKTSWNSTLEEIDLTELLEVNLINQLAPYLLIKELKPLLERAFGNMAHVINVTSSEGLFSYSNKTEHHPHTNMTKASLNMLTRTSAEDFAKSNIYMNSVDVGWISTGAREQLRQRQFEEAYVPPLDPVDGAARITAPIAEALQGSPVFGILLKNYAPHAW